MAQKPKPVDEAESPSAETTEPKAEKASTPKAGPKKPTSKPRRGAETGGSAPKAAEAPVWSSWTPSEDADIEIRWWVSGGPGAASPFAVEVFYLQHLQSPGLLPSARRVPVQTAEGSTLQQLIVRSTLTPEAPDLPFSLFTASDPKPLFKGTLEAVYANEPEEPACDGEDSPSLWVRNLVYRTGSVPEHQLFPATSSGDSSDD